MDFLYPLIRIAHLASMAVWFGAALLAPGDVRRTLARGKPHVEALGDRIPRTLRLSAIAGVLTVASGFGMIFSLGGFAGVSPRIHAGLGLTMIALALEVVALGPTWARIAGLIETGAGGDELTSARKRFSALSGVLHLIRFTVLVLMVYRF